MDWPSGVQYQSRWPAPPIPTDQILPFGLTGACGGCGSNGAKNTQVKGRSREAQRTKAKPFKSGRNKMCKNYRHVFNHKLAAGDGAVECSSPRAIECTGGREDVEEERDDRPWMTTQLEQLKRLDQMDKKRWT